MRFLKILFFGTVFIFLFAVFFHNIIEFDQDLGRHLLMGKIISQSQMVPKNNMLSFTFPNFEFVNSHWLSEVVFFQFNQRFGGTLSLLYLKTIVLLGAFGLTVFSAYKHSKSLAATAVGFALFAPILLERTEIRPEIFSYLFSALFLYVLISYFVLEKGNFKKLLWILPILEVLWVNLHIYFILGPILMSIFLIQKVWDEHRKKFKFLSILKNLKFEIVSTLLVFIATLFNPNLIWGALYPFHVFDNYGYSIVENQNVFFLKDAVFNPNILFFFVAVGALFVSFAIVDWKKIKVNQLLIACLTILPFVAIRSMPFFFLLELPVIAFNLANLNPALKKRVPLLRLEALIYIIVIVTIVLTLWRSSRLISNEYYLSIDSHKRFGQQINESGKGAMDFVQKNKLHGPIFNNFDMGSYIAYRLFPIDKVFVDGRPEAYPAKFFQGEYIPMQMTEDNFKTVDEIYKFKLIIFSHTDATPWAQNFLSEIVANKNYSLVYLDSYSLVLVKRSAYPQLAETTPGSANLKGMGYQDELAFAQVYSYFGRNDLAMSLVQKAYAKNSNSPGALNALSSLYSGSQLTSFLSQNYSKLFHQKTDLVIF